MLLANKISILFLLLGGLFIQNQTLAQKIDNPRILVFSKTDGFRHQSIEKGKEAITALGQVNGFDVDLSEDSEMFNSEKLENYLAVVFLSTTGEILNLEQKSAFEKYIQSGGGFVGVHASADCEYGWEWYGKLNGAYFKNHPRVQRAKLIVHNDPEFPLLDTFPDPYLKVDELYNFKEIPTHVNVLLSLDETSYEGGENGEEHPIVWYHHFDGGRAFYNGLGHTDESFDDPLYLDILLAGIHFAMGQRD